MNNKFLVFGIITLLAVGALVLVVANQKRSSSDSTTMKKQESVNNGDTPMMKDKTTSRYVAYSREIFDAAADKKRVLYFHADWCSICKPIDKEFSENADKLPGDVILFKTDYDKEEALKTKYGVTYQHTFVQVDDRGNEIASWSGGGLAELQAKIK